MTEVFTSIYELDYWRDNESRSGKGSDLAATQVLVSVLPAVLANYGIASMLDLPVGDYNWMRTVDLSGVQYIGADIVGPLIHANSEDYPGVDFRVLDICSDPLPCVDLVFCRDCLVHLDNASVLQAIANVRASGAKWLMATTFPDRSSNPDIATGQWRPINLMAEPFNLPEPVDLINEQCDSDGGAYTDKSMGLWRVE